MWFIEGLVSLLEQAAQQSETSGTELDYNLVFEVLSLTIILVLVIIARGRFNASTNRNSVNETAVKNLSDLFTEYLRQSERGAKGPTSVSETDNNTDDIKRGSGTFQTEVGL